MRVYIGNMLLVKLLDWSDTNIFKDIFISPTQDKQKNNTLSWKSAETAKTSSNFEKKNSEYESQIDFSKRHKTS